MKAVLFGGSGFIGTHLARQLASEGTEVTIADLVAPERQIEGVNYVYTDVRHPISLPEVRPYDVAYNLAAVHRTPGHAPSEYYETNVVGAQMVCDWCDQSDTRHLVFTSSISVYGPSESPKSESSSLAPNSDYGHSKLVAELVHRSWHRASSGRKLRIVRPAVVFGPGEKGNFTRLADALARRRFVYPGRRDTIKSCGHVKDLVRAIRWADELADPELTFNYCYPARYTIEDVCEAFHRVAGFRTPRTLPPSLVRAAVGALQTINPNDRGTVNAARVKKLTSSTNIVPEVLTTRGFEWQTDLDSALSAWQQESRGTFV